MNPRGNEIEFQLNVSEEGNFVAIGPDGEEVPAALVDDLYESPQIVYNPDGSVRLVFFKAEIG